MSDAPGFELKHCASEVPNPLAVQPQPARDYGKQFIPKSETPPPSSPALSVVMPQL
ncbi:MAG: hypothetical protein GX594_16665 [Pirellulaceae bacterium]|nr:hypothetical protein [Pirellulaceae bacterium]